LGGGGARAFAHIGVIKALETHGIAGYELTEADIVMRPDSGAMRGTDFDKRDQAIIEGEKAGPAAIAAGRSPRRR
jgi:predicted acylesterase/phospholipase RssA